MQIITEPEFLELSDIMDKYPYKYIIAGYTSESSLKGCPIYTCKSYEEARSIKDSNFKDFHGRTLGLPAIRNIVGQY